MLAALWAIPAVAASLADDMNRVESFRTLDHPRFARELQRLHALAPRMSPAERWQLRYLDAWETMFRGDYEASRKELQAVADASGDGTLAAKASALLLSNFGATRHYAEAFALANRMTEKLPTITDPKARWAVLFNLSQMFNSAGQTDLALQYAEMTERATMPGDSFCYARSLKIAALNEAKRLPSRSAPLIEAIDTCLSAGQRVVANTMRLIQIDSFLEENDPEAALRALDRIADSVRDNHYYPHMLATQEQRARAYEKLGRYDEAKRAAVAGIAMSQPGDLSSWLMEAYGVLYRVSKAQGKAADALRYYERYTEQDKGYLNDVTARSLAFELSRQHMVVQKLETERLAKQNSILRLQKALETKAVETGRLYIVLLLGFLASVVFWLFRIKRSQLRFQKLARHDGLTGIYNRQHFMGEAQRVLASLERRRAPACLVFIDLDHFKQVNDTHGHAVGDAVLRHAAALCQRHLGPHDLFGRLGGEEFAVLLVERGRDAGMAIAETVRACMEATPLLDDGHAVAFSTSAGLAATETSGYALQRLCREADMALYRAKRAGRNRVMADVDADDGLPLTMRSW